ncbi:MAG TPA: class I SAM-dependent methyltransferase [Bryobacteraceae bacterium]|nr:class I SAM-dependent methyltransferase [Bryobacteraceae bacterium]
MVAERSRFVITKILIALYCAIALCGMRTAIAQSVHPVTGRRIAPVMSVDGADWLEREERQREEQPDKAIVALDLRPGMWVADVGAGTGFYTVRLAKAVLPDGVVIANDIQPGMLERLHANATAQGINNIEMVLGTESDPKLPQAKLDLVLLVDVYHEFSRPQRMLDRIRESLKPDGRLVLLEFRKEDPSVPIRPEHKMSVAEVKAEVLPEGYQFEKVVDTLPWQHIIFFRKADQ